MKKSIWETALHEDIKNKSTMARTKGGGGGGEESQG